MKTSDQKRALQCAVKAAREAGALMRRHRHSRKKINSQIQHDIKLELDVRCQKKIESVLGREFPEVAVLGEEGVAGDPKAAARWVVDPIDGTVNFAYGIPHVCVSIALQVRRQKGRESGATVRRGNGKAASEGEKSLFDGYETVLGVVYDPFCEELWTCARGKPAYLNGKRIHVSQRNKLSEAIISIGFAKSRATLNHMLPRLNQLIHRVRKIRIMGSAALAMVYVASGRMDAYDEMGIRLWDIAAGGLMVECAGGEFQRRPIKGWQTYHMMVTNGRLTRQMMRMK